MNISESEKAFEDLITKPLANVVGKILLNIDYYILDFDLPDFNVEEPNKTGIYAIRMEFGGNTLEVSPAWNKYLRLNNAYHIQTQLGSQGTYTNGLVDNMRLVKIMASQTQTWRPVLFEKLESLTGYGYQSSPQAIQFAFSSASCIVSTGSSSEIPIAGDADEILVFSLDEWKQVEKLFPDRWETLWEYNISSTT